MKPRERALAAINHQEPDRVPIDLGSTIVTTTTRIAYNNLREYLGMEPDPNVVISHRQMDTIYPKEDLLQRYQVDFRSVYLQGPWYFKSRELPDDSFYDEYNLHWKKALYYYDVIERPLAKIETIRDLDQVAWPDPYDPGRVAGVREAAQQLFDTTDYLIVADIMCLGPFEGACVLRGYEEFLTDLYWNPELAKAILEKILETDIALWDLFLQHVGDKVQVVAQGDDLGIQHSMYIKPDMYRKIIKPLHKRLYDFIHSKTQAKVFMHSCGSVYDAIPDLIECGVEILNPIQRSAAKMDIARLKKEFGKDLCFWGGAIDVQQVLPFASLQEIEDEVKRTIDIMAPGGGYVFVPSHNIQADVTPDRFNKVYETVLEYYR
jgi:uroporphyrinogen decarboxylase